MSSEPTPPQEPSSQDTFRHEEIEIHAEDRPPNLLHVDALVPGEQVDRFIRQLHKVGTDLSNVNLAGLLIHVIAEEALDRADRERIWEPSLPDEASIETLRPGVDFRIQFDIAAFSPPDWGFLSKLKVRMPRAEVTDAMIDREVLDQRLDAGRRTPIEGPARPLDELTIDVISRTGNQAILDRRDLKIRIPLEGEAFTIPGLPVPKVRKMLTGVNVGDEFTTEIEIDSDHPQAELRSKTVVTTIAVKGIERIETATLETVLENYGMKAEAILRMQIRLALEQRHEEERVQRAMTQLFPQLAQNCRFEIPQYVRDLIAKRLCDKRRADAEQAGLDEAAIAERMNEFEGRAHTVAETNAREIVQFKFLRRHLDLEGQHTNLDVTAQAEAAARGVRPEDYRSEILDNDETQALQTRAMKRQVAEALLKVVQIEEI